MELTGARARAAGARVPAAGFTKAPGRPVTTGAPGRPVTTGAPGGPVTTGALGGPVTAGRVTTGPPGGPVTTKAPGGPVTAGPPGVPVTTGPPGGPVTSGPPDRRDRGRPRPRHRVVVSATAPAFDTRPTRAGLTSVRVVPVAGRRTGVVHTFLARSGGPTTTRERAQ
ncbi:hypothetical protein [Streptomyces sp. NPDC048187]|uniref:hypothetical protein n=1 Tax=Streptomyces sp. NPDC048187 TaxID=3365509 RepID=UPI003720FD58